MVVERSPWWYRGRGPVSGLIFGAGFGLGFFVAGLAGAPFQPAFVTLGEALWPGGEAFLGWLAVGLVLACLALRMWGSAYLRAGVVWNGDAVAETLIVAGPFRYTRNPLYLGNVLMGLGVGLLAPIAGLLFIGVSVPVFVWMLARYEELGLLRRYGAAYERYAMHVPWLVPRLTPAPPQGNVSPSLRQAVLSEILVAAVLAGMVALMLLHSNGLAIFFALYIAGIVGQAAAARAQRIAA